MTSFESVVNKFNKNYPVYEKNVKSLIDQNTSLRFYISILICIIIVLVIYVIRNQLNKQTPNQE